MKLQNLALTGALLFATPSAPAYAQTDSLKGKAVEMARKVGLHLNTSFREPVDPDVTKGTTFGASVGLSPGRTNGWRYPVGLTLFSQHLHSPNGQQFSRLRTFAVMAGIGYGWHFGRLSTGASLQTGYAVNKDQAEGDLLSAFNLFERNRVSAQWELAVAAAAAQGRILHHAKVHL